MIMNDELDSYLHSYLGCLYVVSKKLNSSLIAPLSKKMGFSRVSSGSTWDHGQGKHLLTSSKRRVATPRLKWLSKGRYIYIYISKNFIGSENCSLPFSRINCSNHASLILFSVIV